MATFYAQIINCIFIYAFSYHNILKWKIQSVSKKYGMKFHKSLSFCVIIPVIVYFSPFIVGMYLF